MTRIERLERQAAAANPPYRPQEDIVGLFIARGLDRPDAEWRVALMDAQSWVMAWLRGALAHMRVVPVAWITELAAAAVTDVGSGRVVRPPNAAIRAHLVKRFTDKELDPTVRLLLTLLEHDLDNPGCAERFIAGVRKAVREGAVRAARESGAISSEPSQEAAAAAPRSPERPVPAAGGT